MDVSYTALNTIQLLIPRTGIKPGSWGQQPTSLPRKLSLSSPQTCSIIVFVSFNLYLMHFLMQASALANEFSLTFWPSPPQCGIIKQYQPASSAL